MPAICYIDAFNSNDTDLHMVGGVWIPDSKTDQADIESSVCSSSQEDQQGISLEVWTPLSFWSFGSSLLMLRVRCRTLNRKKYQKSNLTITYVGKQGRKRFKGSPALKGSQVYSLKFARAVPGLHRWVVVVEWCHPSGHDTNRSFTASIERIIMLWLLDIHGWWISPILHKASLRTHNSPIWRHNVAASVSSLVSNSFQPLLI